ncbi:hypothetical protein G6F66_015355 [Rhizopus arrhizus]|nr:hypothetical protein G6F66_015355 [Rhizopus arrhizus]
MTMPATEASWHSVSTRSASVRQTSCVMFWLPTLATCSARISAMPASCARRGRVRLRTCNGAAGGQHRDDRQRVLRHPRLRTGLGVPAANSGVPNRGSR